MQIVGYETAAGDGPAALLVSRDGDLERRALRPGDELAFALGDRHCAGTTADGRHVACDREATPYCAVHTSRWPCARCTGECSMPIEACYDEHAVYLAAFAPDTIKVGVTRTWRLETRLREQGADRGAHVRTVENGKVARQIEADMAARFPDRVRVDHKLASLHEPVDEGTWAGIVEEFDPIETYAFDYDLGLDGRPVPETIASGTVRGTQGRLLVLERVGTPYAVDLRDLVGYEVTPGRATRDLQASFGAFR